jgi:hypothetical protein
LQPGAGDKHPKAWDIVTVHYTGWTTDGRMFDSSIKRGKPDEFLLNRVIHGFTEAVQMMVAGEKRRFWIPGNLAYGEAKPNDPHAGMGPPRGTLVFEVELISFKEAPKPPETPKDISSRKRVDVGQPVRWSKTVAATVQSRALDGAGSKSRGACAIVIAHSAPELRRTPYLSTFSDLRQGV